MNPGCEQAMVSLFATRWEPQTGSVNYGFPPLGTIEVVSQGANPDFF